MNFKVMVLIWLGDIKLLLPDKIRIKFVILLCSNVGFYSRVKPKFKHPFHYRYII